MYLQTRSERAALYMQLPADMSSFMVRMWTAGPSDFKLFGEPLCTYPGHGSSNEPAVTEVMLSVEMRPCAEARVRGKFVECTREAMSN